MRILTITTNRVDMCRRQMAACERLGRHGLVVCDATRLDELEYRKMATDVTVRNDALVRVTPARFMASLDWAWQHIVLGNPQGRWLILEDDMLPLPGLTEDALFAGSALVMREWGKPWPGILAVDFDRQLGVPWGGLRFDLHPWTAGSCQRFADKHKVIMRLLPWTWLKDAIPPVECADHDITDMAEIIDGLFVHLNGGRARWDKTARVARVARVARPAMLPEDVNLRQAVCQGCAEYSFDGVEMRAKCAAKAGACKALHMDRESEKCVKGKW